MKYPSVSSGAMVISCGIFRDEVAALAREGKFPWEVRFTDSMLHMNPELLGEALADLVRSVETRPVVLLFGDCQPRMDLLAGSDRVFRVAAHNCCELLLGAVEYRRLRREGVFFLLSEWCARWREVFGERLGFVTAESARLFMQEMHRRIAYLDTGVTPVPTEKLAEIGSYFGLPVDVVAVSPGRLADAVFRALEGGGE